MRRALVSFGFLVALTVAIPSARAQELVWAKQLKGTSGDVITAAVTVDAGGNVYTAGYFQGMVDFDPGLSAFNLTSAGGNDGFISKLDAAGNFVWAIHLGGILHDSVGSVALDASGNVYAVGGFQGTADFDPGPGTFNLSATSPSDAFVLKLDGAGGFVWAKRLGGTMQHHAAEVGVDGAGNVYTAGWFLGTGDFDPGPGTFNMTSAGSTDAFISKLDSAGSFVWARQLGGTSPDYGEGLAVDAAGNVHTVGWFQDTADFNPGAAVFNLTSAGSNDVFVSKLDSAGNFVWARRLGGTSNDYAQAVAVDGAGNVVTPGNFQGTADLDPGAGTFNLTSVGDQDLFVSKLDSAGNFVWAKQLGGMFYENSIGADVDSAGNVYTVGHFQGTADFNPGAGTFNMTSVGDNGDAFLSKLDSAGNFAFAGKFGGPEFDAALSVAADASGNVLTVGQFSGVADFDPGPTVHYLAAGPGPSLNGFVVKLGVALNAAGAVPDGELVSGLPLTIGKASGSRLDLDWDFSCAGADVDYEVYEGPLSNFTSHTPLLCSTAGATAATVTPTAGNRYYLVVPTSGIVEGSYGRDSRGVERLPSTQSCIPQSLSCP